MYENVLKNLGWSAEEVDVYTTLLHLGTQPASIVARHLNKKRTTIRVYLEQLVKKGFVRYTWRGKAQYFTAKKPDESLESLQHHKAKAIQSWDNDIRAFSGIVPELTSIVRQDVNIPKVTYYEGIHELKRMYIDSLTSNTEILCLSSVEDLWDLFGKEYDHWYVTKRTKRGIPVRYIAKDTPLERKETKKDKKYLRQSRHFPVNIFDISNEINIYDGKVSIITLKNEKMGVLIQSQEIYHSMKVMFEILWQTAAK
ncbi:MAG: helix-turn-helix domain-containing protein [Patescibacteria group bacterium]